MKKDLSFKLWVYGKPFSGKTYFASEFPKPLVLSTDGNASHYDVDVKRIKTIEEFSNAVDDFIKNDTEHETLVVDVLEHIYDMQRDWYLEKFGIEHEQDKNDFGKTYAIIRKGFWSIIRELSEIDGKNIVIISHEDEYVEVSRYGKETTKFRPNLDDTKEGFHNKIAGIVTFVMRAYTDTDSSGKRTYKLSCGSTGDEFSGARLELKNKTFGNTYDEFVKEIVK